MKINDIVIFDRPRNKGRAFGKVIDIYGVNVLIQNPVDTDFKPLRGGFRNMNINKNLILGVIVDATKL